MQLTGIKQEKLKPDIALSVELDIACCIEFLSCRRSLQLRILTMPFLSAIQLGIVGCATSDDPSAGSVSSLINSEISIVDREIADAGLYPGVLEGYARESTRIINPDHVVDEALLVPVNGEFTGTVEDLVKTIAASIGYSTAAEGEKPGAPIIVVVVQYELPAIGILREGFLQAKGRARLVIDQTSKTMTIVYRRPERSPVPNLEDWVI
ncbi:DotD/TraH family lipoprotein [Nitratireductor sp. XY-223]|uniref:DotD/TraH family lipoprotein n=1 Tax=Nitratireductor sp. XY-223 TaxID=2561926 RepID=UPI0010AA2493|nr:DotD/TraH family lipoprotein [Nitratireductor sp. XY-223]